MLGGAALMRVQFFRSFSGPIRFARYLELPDWHVQPAAGRSVRTNVRTDTRLVGFSLCPASDFRELCGGDDLSGSAHARKLCRYICYGAFVWRPVAAGGARRGGSPGVQRAPVFLGALPAH